MRKKLEPVSQYVECASSFSLSHETDELVRDLTSSCKFSFLDSWIIFRPDDSRLALLIFSVCIRSMAGERICCCMREGLLMFIEAFPGEATALTFRTRLKGDWIADITTEADFFRELPLFCCCCESALLVSRHSTLGSRNSKLTNLLRWNSTSVNRSSL